MLGKLFYFDLGDVRKITDKRKCKIAGVTVIGI